MGLGGRAHCIDLNFWVVIGSGFGEFLSRIEGGFHGGNVPVTIRKILASDTGAGKPQHNQHHKLQMSAIAYSYIRPNAFEVTVSKPIIDGLAFTVPVPTSLESHVLKKLEALASESGGLADKVFAATKANKNGSTKYLRSYEMAFKQANVLVQVKPQSKTNNFLRVELNPGLLQPLELKLVWELLSGVSENQISEGMLAEEAKVTRIDVAVDILNIDPEDILIDHKFTGKTNAYFGSGGKIETVYLNKKSKGSTTYLYDKKVQAQETGKSLDAGVNQYGEAKYTRFECRVQTQKPFKKLASLKNPLTKVELVDMDGCVAPGEPHVWALFQDACRYRGLVGALKLLPTKERGEFHKVIKKSSDLLWRPDDIWVFWKNSLETNGLLLGK